MVNFQILYTIPTGAKREYGLVSIPNGGPQVPDAALAEGWVKLRDDAGRKRDKDEGSEESEAQLLQRLAEIESKARSEGKGLWKEGGGGGAAWVETVHELSSDSQELVGEWKGKDVDGAFRRLFFFF